MVRGAVHNGVSQLLNMNVGSNAHALTGTEDYVMPARTRQEVLDSQAQVADNRTVDPRRKMAPQDPARQFTDLSDEDLSDEPGKIIVPTGYQRQPIQPRKPNADGTVKRNDDGPVPWLL